MVGLWWHKTSWGTWWPIPSIRRPCWTTILPSEVQNEITWRFQCFLWNCHHLVLHLSNFRYYFPFLSILRVDLSWFMTKIHHYMGFLLTINITNTVIISTLALLLKINLLSSFCLRRRKKFVLILFLRRFVLIDLKKKILF